MYGCVGLPPLVVVDVEGGASVAAPAGFHSNMVEQWLCSVGTDSQTGLDCGNLTVPLRSKVALLRTL